jgi:hypothetical protein
MADSPPITVTLTAPLMQTQLSMWDLNPKSGAAPLTITWLGYLSPPSPYTPNDPIWNGEPIQLQVDMGDGQWVDIPGATAVTGYNSSTQLYGYFNGTYTIPGSWPTGTYRFRVHYPGSAIKGLAGCEPPVASAMYAQQYY